MKERRPWTYFTCKTWTSGISRKFPRFLETTQARQFSSTQCTVVSFPAARNTQFPRTLCKVCDERTFRTLHGAAEAYSWKAVIHLSRYATVNSTNVLSSHWFSFVWLAYSGNKFFRVGPNISEKFVPGGTNFRGVQIKRDTSQTQDFTTVQFLIAYTVRFNMLRRFEYCKRSKTGGGNEAIIYADQSRKPHPWETNSAAGWD